MKIVKLGFILLVSLLIFCTNNTKNNRLFFIYSSDKSNCVTVITKGKNLYFINGRHLNVPKMDFVKVDINKIYPIGDAIGICWNKNGYIWEIVNNNAVIVKNNLIDSTKHKFNTSWEMDSSGIPNALKYNKNQCGTIDLETMTINKNKLILESPFGLASY